MIAWNEFLCALVFPNDRALFTMPIKINDIFNDPGPRMEVVMAASTIMTVPIMLLFLVLASLPVKNFWCRYLCPYGALMGILAFAGPTRIQRDPDKCIGCNRCSRICPSHLQIDRKLRIHSPECIGCMDCTEVCPVEDTLQLKTAGFDRKAWSALTLGAVIIVLFAGLVYTSRITGHWQTRVPETEFRMILQKIDSPELTHP